MDHDLLVALKALADPNRLRVAGACASAPRTVAALAEELGLPEPAIRRHVKRLTAAGLLATDPRDGGTALRVDAIHAVGRRLAAIEPDGPSFTMVAGPDGSPLPREEARVIRGFFRDDHLTTIPSQAKKRLIVITYVRDRCFTEDRSYPEKEVNQRLALFHPDVATLRRAMVDGGLMTRAGGVYRRST